MEVPIAAHLEFKTEHYVRHRKAALVNNKKFKKYKYG